MEKEKSIVLRGNSEALYVWPIWVLAITFGLLNYAFGDSDLDLRRSSGVIFILISLPSLIASLVILRGMWSLVFLLSLIIMILTLKITIDTFDLAAEFYEYLPIILMRIAEKITYEIYFMIGFPLMVISFISYLFAYRKCVVVTAKEIVVQGVYKGKQTYDSKNSDFKERRRDWLRYILGFYAGDLEIYISHGTQYERIEIKNITDINEKMAVIHRLKQ